MEINYRPREAARLLGVTVATLQRWDREGKLTCTRLPSGRRIIAESEIKRLLHLQEKRISAIYARVSSQDQKKDLEEQIKVLQQKDSQAMVFSDIKSGLKFTRKGLQKLLDLVIENRISIIYITYEDRLARFGFDLLQYICTKHRTDIVVLYKSELQTPHEELVKDLITIVTSFSSRLYGLRSHKTKKIIQTIKKIDKENDLTITT